MDLLQVSEWGVDWELPKNDASPDAWVMADHLQGISAVFVAQKNGDHSVFVMGAPHVAQSEIANPGARSICCSNTILSPPETGIEVHATGTSTLSISNPLGSEIYILLFFFATWWFIPLSKWVSSP